MRMACAFSGGLLVSVFTLPIWWVWPMIAPVGFQNTMLLYAVIATLLLWVAFAASKESSAEATSHRRSALQSDESGPLDFRPVTQNPHLWVVIGIFCCGMLGFTVRSAATRLTTFSTTSGDRI